MVHNKLLCFIQNTHTLRSNKNQGSPFRIQIIFYIRIVNMTMTVVMCCRKDGACRICLPQWFFSPMISWQRFWLRSISRTWYDGHSLRCICPPEPSCTVTKELHWQTVWAIPHKSSECRGSTFIFIINFLQVWPLRRKVPISKPSTVTTLLYQVKNFCMLDQYFLANGHGCWAIT